MHAQGVAHRDCALANIMMDASSMYPDGFHPIHLDHAPDGFTRTRSRPRSRANVKYYFIDFGESSIFQEGDERLVTGVYGLDRDVPEYSEIVPYDPFPVDIYCIGNVIQTEILDVCCSCLLNCCRSLGFLIIMLPIGLHWLRLSQTSR